MDKYLIIDLDCSLLKIDLFKETLGKSLLLKPWVFFKTCFLAWSNRPLAKKYISRKSSIDWQWLPFNKKIIGSYYIKGMSHFANDFI